MFCQKCGRNVPSGVSNCPSCGNPMPGAAQRQMQPSQSYQYQNTVMSTVEPKTVLILGILSCALGYIWLAGSIAGIVLAALAISKSGKYYAEGNPPSGMVKTGRILGIVGLVFAIIFTVYFSVISLACVGACMTVLY